MLKNYAKRKILTSTIALFIVALLYFFPTKFNTLETVEQNISYIDTLNLPIYLLNKDNYVVRTSVVTTTNDPIEQAKEIIATLTLDNPKNDFIPSSLKAIIPKNTRLLSIALDKGLLKINFSKELLNVSKEQEIKVIEALVYSLTEIEEIDNIMIFIEDEKLDYLPQNKLRLPLTLNRDLGINKTYDISNLKDLSKTTVYYLGKEEDLVYYIPITKIDNNQNNKVEIIIEELKSSPIYETNLISYLASSVELLNYETLEEQVILSFNNKILANLDDKNIAEEVKYSISLSLKDTLKVNEVIFKVNDEIIASV